MSAPTSPPPSRRSKKQQIECKVLLLDDTSITVTIPVKSAGQVLYDEVIRKLQLLEADYFDLEYTDVRRMRCWLDHDKPILRQLPRHNLDFQFLVKFYTPDPGLLEEDYTRYLFALQLRRDLASGALPCQEHTAVLLASYIVQAEFGDFSDELDVPGYLKDVQLLPDLTEELELKIAEHHRDHVGQSPATAEFILLDTARKVDLYGIQMHSAKDHEGVPLQVAAAHLGVLAFQNQTKINTFSWGKIRKLSFKRKKFLVKLHPEGYGFYKDIVEFFFESRNDCKNFWKKCLEHHAFFRCHSVKRLPRNKTRLVSRGSSFRYCGRTQKQLAEYVRENCVRRPEFHRSTSMKTISLSHSVATTPKVGTLKSKDHHRSHPNIRASNSSHAICLERALAREKLRHGGHRDTTSTIPSPTLQKYRLSGTCNEPGKTGEDDGGTKLRKTELSKGTLDDFNCSYFKDNYNSNVQSSGNAEFQDNMSQDSYQLTESRDSLDFDQVEATPTESGHDCSEVVKRLEERTDLGDVERTGDEASNEVKVENGGGDGKGEQVLPDKSGTSDETIRLEEISLPFQDETGLEIESSDETAGAEQKTEDLGIKCQSPREDVEVVDHLTSVPAGIENGLEDLEDTVPSTAVQKRKRLSQGEALQESDSPPYQVSDSPIQHVAGTPGITDSPKPALDNPDIEPESRGVNNESGRKVTDVLGCEEAKTFRRTAGSQTDLDTKASCFSNTETLLPSVNSQLPKAPNEINNKDVEKLESVVAAVPGENLTKTEGGQEVIKENCKTLKKEHIFLCSGENVVTNTDTDFPYILHRRHFASKGDQTGNGAVKRSFPALSLRSRSLSPGNKLSKEQQRAELEKVKATLCEIASQPEKNSPGMKRILDFVIYNKLPPRDSFSSKDDSLSPTAFEKVFSAKAKMVCERRSDNTDATCKQLIEQHVTDVGTVPVTLCDTNSIGAGLASSMGEDITNGVHDDSMDSDNLMVNPNIKPDLDSEVCSCIAAETKDSAELVGTDLGTFLQESDANSETLAAQISDDLELNDLPSPPALPSLEVSTTSLENFLMNVVLPPPIVDGMDLDSLAPIGESGNHSAVKCSVESLILPPPADIEQLLDDASLQVELHIYEPLPSEVLMGSYIRLPWPEGADLTKEVSDEVTILELPDVDVYQEQQSPHRAVEPGNFQSDRNLGCRRMSEDTFSSLPLSPLPPPFPWCDELEHFVDEPVLKSSEQPLPSLDFLPLDGVQPISNEIPATTETSTTIKSSQLLTEQELLIGLPPGTNLNSKVGISSECTMLSYLSSQLPMIIEPVKDDKSSLHLSYTSDLEHDTSCLVDPSSIQPSLSGCEMVEQGGVERDQTLLDPTVFADPLSHSDISDEDEVERPYAEISLQDLARELELEAQAKPFHVPLSGDIQLNLSSPHDDSFQVGRAPESGFGDHPEVSFPGLAVSDLQFQDDSVLI